MELEETVSKIEEVEEQYRGFYEEQEAGGFKLKFSIKGMGSKDKLDEFRGNNHKLQDELDKMKADIESEKKKKTDQAAIDKGEAAGVIADKDRQLADLTSQLETLTGKVGTYEEREKVKLAAVVEKLPEDIRANFDGLPVGQAITLAENIAEKLTQRKPFGIPPKEIAALNIDKDLPTMSPQEKLAYHNAHNQK